MRPPQYRRTDRKGQGYKYSWVIWFVRVFPTVDGTSIWAGDGVHLTSTATRVAAMKLMADLASGGAAGGELASKRARLESVITAPAAPWAQKAEPQMAGPPSPKPVPPPLWLSGQLSAAQRDREAGGQSRGQQRGGRGGPGQRGGHSGYRGAGRALPRGGTP